MTRQRLFPIAGRVLLVACSWGTHPGSPHNSPEVSSRAGNINSSHRFGHLNFQLHIFRRPSEDGQWEGKKPSNTGYFQCLTWLFFFQLPVKYIPSLLSSQAVHAEVPRRQQRPQGKGRFCPPSWELEQSLEVRKDIWTLSIRQKDYSCLGTRVEQATETAHWICSELISWEDRQETAQCCVLRL